MAAPIFTSETMVTRALAAEIRHEATRFTGLLERRIGLAAGTLGQVTAVQCEAAENVDILLEYSSGSLVGIEGKLDHAVSEDQLVRESRVVDHLVLVVLDPDDADGFAKLVAGVLTWDEALNCFPRPRITPRDIASIPATKRIVERKLRALGVQGRLPDGWSAIVERGGSGLPSVAVKGPVLADGRRFQGQIQTVQRDSKIPLEVVEFEYHVGIQVRPDKTDFPKNVSAKPAWIDYLETLRDIIGTPGEQFSVRTGTPRAGRTEHGARKMELVRTYLPDHLWLAYGYVDWALGVKSVPVGADNLETLADEATKLWTAWQNVQQI